MIHPQQAAAMLPLVRGILSGNLASLDNAERKEAKKVSCADFYVGSSKQVNPYTDKSVYVTYLDGTMTKHGSCYSYGTREIAQELLEADKDPEIIGHIIVADSGGGAADSVPELSSAIKQLTKPIVSYIDENYDKPISLEEISDHFGLSSEYFSRLFTHKIGIPFKKHLNQVRLSHIYHDLCSSDAPIMEIVDRHGFTNYKLFNRMFKEIYGATPREVRRRIAMMD